MNQVALTSARLPVPDGMNIEPGYWRILCEAIFPSANSPESVVMAIDYCKARNLDILKKPVHIVPMWSTKKGGYVETVWPSINEIQVTASRTGAYAGMDKPEFGPMIEREFKGRKDSKAVAETAVNITYPEWCSITVYRMIEGQRCAFTEPVYWLESYGRRGKTELPNDGWEKRPIGMIIKVAKAFSLRAAFPEEGGYAAEEMEGRTLEDFDAPGVVIESGPKKMEWKELRKIYGTSKEIAEKIGDIHDAIDQCVTMAELKAAWSANSAHIKAIGSTEIGEEYILRLEEYKDKAKDRIQLEQANIAAYGEENYRKMSKIECELPVPETVLPEGQSMPKMFKRVTV